MIIVRAGDMFRIIACHDLTRYRKYKDYKIIGHLEGDYPSLKSLEISKKNTKEFMDYLNEKIKEHNKLIQNYKIQLKQFKDDLALLGVE